MSGEKRFLDVGVPFDDSSDDPFVSAGNLLGTITGFTPERVQSELNWYSQERGYPLSYLAGNRAVWALRREAEAHTKKSGDDFARHFHDVFLPEDYPAAWRWRGYNEQLAIGAMIGAGGAEIVFSSAFAIERLAAELSETVLAQLPLFPGAVESSLWLRKSAPPLPGTGP